MSSKIKAVIFDRVSSAEQRDGYSLTAQRTSSVAYANRNNLKVVKDWSVDESASKEDDRQEFFDMIEFVKANGISAVIFDKVDRACRGLKSANLINELMEENNVRFHFTRDNLVIDKHSQPQEKLRFNLGIILAKFYIDNLTSEINKGNQAKRLAGVWSAKAPFGYRNTELGGRRGIATNEAEMRIGAEVFELYSTGNYGYEELAKLVKDRIPERTDVTKRLIENMIPNPFYYGVMKIKGQVYPATHAPMISKKLFDDCQKIKGIRALSSASKRKGFIVKPLMGIFRCGECDHSITGESQKKAGGGIHIYYRCANSKCPQNKKRINQKELFGIIKKTFEPFKKWTPKATEAFIKNVHASLGDLEMYTQKMTGELAGARMELKQRIGVLGGLMAEGKLSKAEHDAAVAVPMALLEDNTAEIQAYHEADLVTFQKGCNIIQLFQKAYDYMQLDGNELEKVKLIKAVLSNPKLKDRSICFDYEKPLDVLLDLTSFPKMVEDPGRGFDCSPPNWPKIR